MNYKFHIEYLDVQKYTVLPFINQKKQVDGVIVMNDVMNKSRE